ncbi:MAG: hydantoinase B/oxoprolinase family protein [Verrucomicrobiota bacterium]|nr:hydantoinase B/oxoprolinase family protein [Verrucomicrobiota bacterium]
MKKEWKIWIDTGGTFTDCISQSPTGQTTRHKVLSSSCLRGTLIAINSPTEIEFRLNQPIPPQFTLGQSIRVLGENEGLLKITNQPTSNILHISEPLNKKTTIGQSIEIKFDLEAPILAAYLSTCTLPNKPLPPLSMHLATTRGTNALLEKKGANVTLFITKGFEDLLVIGDQKRMNLFDINARKSTPITSKVFSITERMDATGKPISKIELPQISPPNHKNQAAAIAFLNSHTNPEHEQKLRKHLFKSGWRHISTSSDLAPVIKILPRTETAVVDAYLTPLMSDYLDGVSRHIKKGKLHVMTSAGGLVSCNDYRAKDSLLSGPAGGVVGAAFIGNQAGINKIIGFDMGGTSTDVCRFDGKYNYKFEHQIGNARVVTPVLNIETVAAGGGSICDFNGEELSVGPESAGAAPGPACYGGGGPLTITDINLLLNRLDPKELGIPIDIKAAQEALDKIKTTIPEKLSDKELLLGFLDIANERMADAVRKISIQEGYDPCDYTLVAFGGAGGQHACAIADKLGITSILCPSDAGLLSARGLREAVIERFAEQQILKPLNNIEKKLSEIIKNLEHNALSQLLAEGFKNHEIFVRRALISLRHQGQESTEEIEYNPRIDIANSFKDRHKNLFGYWPNNKIIEVVSVRIIASTYPSKTKQEKFKNQNRSTPQEGIISRNKLRDESQINGPSLVQDIFCTVNIDQNWTGTVGSKGTIKLKKSSISQHTKNFKQSPLVERELFTSRLNSIVEDMGQLLKRTAVSTNIKERLDFSCALLDLNGQLVANAPHIPVHLGALGLCVRSVTSKKKIGPGDMIITNHPGYGGSHLPDITVISPVFDDKDVLLGYIANRAHHAELGGISPGSMPPLAKSLAEEGVVIPPTFLYQADRHQFDKIEKILNSAQWPTRCIEDNLADIKAQVAANFLGAKTLKKMALDHGTKKIIDQIKKLRSRASNAMIRRIKSLNPGKYIAKEKLDDGTELIARIDIEKDKIKIDFNGTSPPHTGNFNATPAIVQSAIIYVLRLLVNESIPLNEGLLDCTEIDLPHCLLNPHFPIDPNEAPPVVGGNVETSQKLVNLLLKPFAIVAASQGTMNNLIFGNERCSYYETICGGTGAGPHFDGIDAAHSHMTNTAITDPEILEWRFPVRLEQFSIRKKSGGRGRFKGGNGVIRELFFTEAVSLSLLTQNRNQGAYGLNGGEEGSPGEQYLIKRDGNKIKLKSITQKSLEPGDRLIIKTPGGGGFGMAKNL